MKQKIMFIVITLLSTERQVYAAQGEIPCWKMCVSYCYDFARACCGRCCCKPCRPNRRVHPSGSYVDAQQGLLGKASPRWDSPAKRELVVAQAAAHVALAKLVHHGRVSSSEVLSAARMPVRVPQHVASGQGQAQAAGLTVQMARKDSASHKKNLSAIDEKGELSAIAEKGESNCASPVHAQAKNILQWPGVSPTTASSGFGPTPRSDTLALPPTMSPEAATPLSAHMTVLVRDNSISN